MKTEVMSIKEFMQRAPGRRQQCIVIDCEKVSAHIRKHGGKYAAAGLTLALFAGIPDISLAATDGIDIKAGQIYRKLLTVGKWVIIFKGGIDCIQSVSSGDFPHAKKQFMGYLLIFALLMGLPWAMDEIEGLFDDI